jgi:dTDP-D-glucose 4,6-dehydratase
MEKTRRILVTGAVGQIGSELTPALRERYGRENVVAAGHRTKPSVSLEKAGPFETVDVTVRADLERVIDQYGIDTIYHLAAILSAAGEKNPQLAWSVNMDGLCNVLEVAREKKLRQVARHIDGDGLDCATQVLDGDLAEHHRQRDVRGDGSGRFRGEKWRVHGVAGRAAGEDVDHLLARLLGDS